ncbi:Ssl1-like-domain-containing protein, partial [Lineolata rhizophorae]
RLRADTKPFQRGIIRHVALVLDMSEAMLEKDMRPTRFAVMINYAIEYVREFFEQNPISQVSVMGMHDGICVRISELSGNPNDHIEAIQAIRNPTNPRDSPREPKGSPSLQNALQMARAALYHTPSHGTREVIIILGALLTLDPGDIHTTIGECVRDGLRVGIIGMAGRLKVCQEICERTNTGDGSSYNVCLDQEHFRDLLLATTTPPVIRKPVPESEDVPTAPATTSADASLLQMGFPSRTNEDTATICACHGHLTRGGYVCPRCSTKVCALPATCPSCGMTLILSTHLARSYHHLFPLRNWREVSWERARRAGSVQCKACLAPFPPLPSPPGKDGRAKAAHDRDKQRQGAGASDVVRKAIASANPPPPSAAAVKDSAAPSVSESSRYECRDCGEHFCVDCDVYCHQIIHNCPGCLSKPPKKAPKGDETEKEKDGSNVADLVGLSAPVPDDAMDLTS